MPKSDGFRVVCFIFALKIVLPWGDKISLQNVSFFRFGFLQKNLFSNLFAQIFFPTVVTNPKGKNVKVSEGDPQNFLPLFQMENFSFHILF